MNTIKHYLDLLQGAFLIRTLHKYSGSEARTRASSPKLLPLNNALVHAFRSPEEVDANPQWYGRVFEAAVGAALLRSSGQVYYWREGRFEVDFVIELRGKIYAIEVKSSASATLRGLERFVRRHPGCIPLVVDREKGLRLLESTNVDDLLLDGGLQ